jgi:tetratricopeptide (TPR) repeat protein
VIGLADIERFSRFSSEKEVLFSIGTTFLIETIRYGDHFKKWCVQLILTHQGLEYVQEHFNSTRKDLTETNPARLFGKLLIAMGRYAKAERYYKHALDSLTENHEDLPSLYHGLGYINYLNGNYLKVIEYDTIEYQKRKETLPPNHLDIARSALNHGCDHVRNGTHYIATELLQEALDISMNNYSGKDHSNIAIVLAAIGDNCIYVADY